eukprot:Filipodium_phascolosomae@DN3605_c0_g1_i1.p1
MSFQDAEVSHPPHPSFALNAECEQLLRQFEREEARLNRARRENGQNVYRYTDKMDSQKIQASLPTLRKIGNYIDLEPIFAPVPLYLNRTAPPTTPCPSQRTSTTSYRYSGAAAPRRNDSNFCESLATKFFSCWAVRVSTVDEDEVELW